MSSEKNTGFLEKFYFWKLEQDVDLDRCKDNLSGVQNILEKHIALTQP